jgi:uncharacterized integral membrane protein
MNDISNSLYKLISVMPAIIMMTLVNVMITSAVAGVVMLELQAAYPGSKWPLAVAILLSMIVYSWIVFNHKIRNYIKKETQNEQ